MLDPHARRKIHIPLYALYIQCSIYLTTRYTWDAPLYEKGDVSTLVAKNLPLRYHSGMGEMISCNSQSLNEGSTFHLLKSCPKILPYVNHRDTPKPSISLECRVDSRADYFYYEYTSQSSWGSRVWSWLETTQTSDTTVDCQGFRRDGWMIRKREFSNSTRAEGSRRIR